MDSVSVGAVVVAVSGWPAVPREGQYVRLPISLPPLLLDALGYSGDARLVALAWLPDGDDLVACDGPIAQIADPRGWSVFSDHLLGRVLLRPYHLRPTDGLPAHVLVADTWEGTLSVGRTKDVGELIGSQPNLVDLTASMVDSSVAEQAAERTADLLVTERAMKTAGVADPGRGARHALRLWLDERVELLKDVAPPPRPDRGPADPGEIPPSPRPGPPGLDLG